MYYVAAPSYERAHIAMHWCFALPLLAYDRLPAKKCLGLDLYDLVGQFHLAFLHALPKYMCGLCM
jgi:hypothetical protein